MSRKIFGPITPEAKSAGQGTDTAAATAAPAPRTDPLRIRPLMGLETLPGAPKAAPVGAISSSLSELSERNKNAVDIEKKLAAGTTVVELDTALIDPSFVTDRMPLTGDALDDLIDAIRTNTQLSPVMVRPHPEKVGRYQTAFGHRRILATKALGIPVRAIVRNLSDEEMVIAQGQENHARKDLTYIEKARFAQRLDDRFSRETIMEAMSVYKSDLSNMLTVARRIPDEVSDAIGPAPKVGRRGWIELAELLKSPRLLEVAKTALKTAEMATVDTDERFKAVLAAVRRAPPKAKTETWSHAGKPLARVVSSSERVSVAIDRRQAPGFAEFVMTKLKDLYAEYEKLKAEQGGTG
ncbi:MAG: plasmid partitioning protein RepB [Alphaproteobacteria bacterium]|nr:plasmid partitioning protein RepB [Reyranella sp.]MBL6940098.1 plasmid partitioning protein RepB [Alphaproteobacteria bacterium]MBL7100185.1 plasmid partitioning protein RepB [Alphaproteobacteria bacterium]